MTTLLEKVRKTIREHHLLAKGDRVILGLSGGPDSLCLFYVLKDFARELEFELSCVHVNHMFRQHEAKEDQKSVEVLCEKNAVSCYSYEIDCPALAKEEGLSLEEAGRKARYEAFEKAARQMTQGDFESRTGTVKVAVAQNQNDQAETVLMRLVRGSGLDGLGAMEYSRKDRRGYTVIRPLLDVSRKEIEEFCSQCQLQPRRDSTNEDDHYLRNRIRHQLLPLLEERFNPNIIEGLSRLAENLQNDRVYLQEQTAKVTKFARLSPQLDTVADEKAGQREDGKEEGNCVFDRKKLKELPEALRNRVIRNAFGESGLNKDVAAAHVRQANSLLESSNASGIVEFPQGYTLRVSYDRVFISNPKRESSKSESIALKQSYLSPAFFQSSASAEGNPLASTLCYLDAEAIRRREKEVGTIELRTRKPGDWMAMSFGTKRIQDLFIDSRVPKDERDSVYMVALGSEILWIPDIRGESRYTASYKVGEDTAQVMRLEIVK